MLGVMQSLESTIKEIMAMCWLRNMLFPYHGNPIFGHAHFSKPVFLSEGLISADPFCQHVCYCQDNCFLGIEHS